MKKVKQAIIGKTELAETKGDTTNGKRCNTVSLTCIGCPMGCQVTVEMDGGDILGVTGYTCKRGLDYAQKEVTDPTRIVTSTVRVLGGAHPFVAVKTARDIPKGKIRDAMAALRGLAIPAPVSIGDVVLPDTFGLGCEVVATQNCGAG